MGRFRKAPAEGRDDGCLMLSKIGVLGAEDLAKLQRSLER